MLFLHGHVFLFVQLLLRLLMRRREILSRQLRDDSRASIKPSQHRKPLF